MIFIISLQLFGNFRKIVSKFPQNFFKCLTLTFLKVSIKLFLNSLNFSKISSNFSQFFCNFILMSLFWSFLAVSSKLSHIFVFFKVAPKYLKSLFEEFLKFVQYFFKISRVLLQFFGKCRKKFSKFYSPFNERMPKRQERYHIYLHISASQVFKKSSFLENKK